MITIRISREMAFILCSVLTVAKLDADNVRESDPENTSIICFPVIESIIEAFRASLTKKLEATKE